MLLGMAWGTGCEEAALGAGVGLLAALLTRWMVLPGLTLYEASVSSFFMTRPE